MAVQRAVVSGWIGGLVAIRNMFTADVVEAGGDDSLLLWDTYLNLIYSVLVPSMHTVLTYEGYELQAREAGSWVPFEVNTLPYSGEITGDPLPNAVALVLLGKAEGIKHVGRKFFSGIAEAMSFGNVLTGDLLTQAALALLAYVAPVEGIGGGTLTPGVLDKNDVFHPFVGGVVSSLLGSMRRRKPGVGI